MAFLPVYHSTRNLPNLAQLGDKTKEMALKWYKLCVAEGLNVLIYETIRTEAKQREYVNSGASQTMRSYHLKGQALDFVMCSGNSAVWNYNTPEAKRAIALAKQCGFIWGGDWDNDGSSSDEDFIDSPHLQNSSLAYGADTFNTKGQIDFDGAPAPTPAPAQPAPTPGITDLPTGVFYLEQNQGKYSDDVKRIQTILNAVYFKCGTADGYFGAKTKDAITRFQKVYLPYDVDGVYGPKTRAKLIEVYNAQ